MPALHPNQHNLRFTLVVPAIVLLAGCSTSFWYTQIQGAQYDKCERLQSPDDRRRCKAETYPNEDRYRKQREAARSASG